MNNNNNNFNFNNQIPPNPVPGQNPPLTNNTNIFNTPPPSNPIHES
jgi:hypothetical protein